ncbi:hypothetical protein [Ensifer aridi]|uniref:hypothetical protein n=1 Tax=Ensifer aridi TaxID=1708715 RepID=UPI001FCDECCD|nr:hypothetical protein [Ensifer aridi]
MFLFHNPTPGVDTKYGPNPDNTTIVDFDPAEDTLAFDAVGFYSDGFGANFVNNAGGPGQTIEQFPAARPS